MNITVHGDAYRIEPGATYVIQLDQHMPLEVLSEAREKWEQATGAKAVFLGPNLRLVPADPHDA